MVALQVALCQRIEGSVALVVHHQFMTQHISHQSHAVLAVVMIHVAVYLVLVNTFGQQLTDDKEYLGARRVKRKAARISHHSAIDGNGEMLALALVEPHLPYQSEHHSPTLPAMS